MLKQLKARWQTIKQDDDAKDDVTTAFFIGFLSAILLCMLAATCVGVSMGG